jgi:hypothetical protein
MPAPRFQRDVPFLASLWHVVLLQDLHAQTMRVTHVAAAWCGAHAFDSPLHTHTAAAGCLLVCQLLHMLCQVLLLPLLAQVVGQTAASSVVESPTPWRVATEGGHTTNASMCIIL